MNTIEINGEKYIKASDYEELKLSEYVIVRTYSAGVFAGNIESKNGKEVVMRNARRLWFWDGAASLSQLAMEGTLKPENGSGDGSGYGSGSGDGSGSGYGSGLGSE